MLLTPHPVRRLTAGVTALVFSLSLICPPVGAAPRQLLGLPAPGAMVLKTRAFAPALIRGIQIHPDDPLKFNFLIDTGDTGITGPALKAEANKMIKYFLAALTVPEEQIWVNLSPYEGDRMVGEALGRTEMGRDLLAQDYLLKQLSASLLSPDEPTGKDYWQRVYQRAQDLFGTTQVPVDTFNKIWIVPQEAVVYEDERGAYVGRSHLQVMLEADYLALEENLKGSGPAVTDAARAKAQENAQVTADVVREVLLPEIEREVNEGTTFANLRQMYHAMILATWYKTALKESLLGQVYADQGKTRGVDLEDPAERQAIYDQYLEAFRVGVYDAIKEDLDPVTNQVLPRRYFSGGFGGNMKDALDLRPLSSPAAAQALATRSPIFSTETVAIEISAKAASGLNDELTRQAEQFAMQGNSSPVKPKILVLRNRENMLAPRVRVLQEIFPDADIRAQTISGSRQTVLTNGLEGWTPDLVFIPVSVVDDKLRQPGALAQEIRKVYSKAALVATGHFVKKITQVADAGEEGPGILYIPDNPLQWPGLRERFLSLLPSAEQEPVASSPAAPVDVKKLYTSIMRTQYKRPVTKEASSGGRTIVLDQGVRIVARPLADQPGWGYELWQDAQQIALAAVASDGETALPDQFTQVQILPILRNILNQNWDSESLRAFVQRLEPRPANAPTVLYKTLESAAQDWQETLLSYQDLLGETAISDEETSDDKGPIREILLGLRQIRVVLRERPSPGFLGTSGLSLQIFLPGEQEPFIWQVAQDLWNAPVEDILHTAVAKARAKAHKAYVELEQEAVKQGLEPEAVAARASAEGLPVIEPLAISPGKRSRAKTTDMDDSKESGQLSQDIKLLAEVLTGMTTQDIRDVKKLPGEGRTRVDLSGGVQVIFEFDVHRQETAITVRKGVPGVAFEWTVQGTLSGDALTKDPLSALRDLLTQKQRQWGSGSTFSTVIRSTRGLRAELIYDALMPGQQAVVPTQDAGGDWAREIVLGRGVSIRVEKEPDGKKVRYDLMQDRRQIARAEVPGQDGPAWTSQPSFPRQDVIAILRSLLQQNQDTLAMVAFLNWLDLPLDGRVGGRVLDDQSLAGHWQALATGYDWLAEQPVVEDHTEDVGGVLTRTIKFAKGDMPENHSLIIRVADDGQQGITAEVAPPFSDQAGNRQLRLAGSFLTEPPARILTALHDQAQTAADRARQRVAAAVSSPAVSLVLPGANSLYDAIMWTPYQRLQTTVEDDGTRVIAMDQGVRILARLDGQDITYEIWEGDQRIASARVAAGEAQGLSFPERFTRKTTLPILRALSAQNSDNEDWARFVARKQAASASGAQDLPVTVRREMNLARAWQGRMNAYLKLSGLGQVSRRAVEEVVDGVVTRTTEIAVPEQSPVRVVMRNPATRSGVSVQIFLPYDSAPPVWILATSFWGRPIQALQAVARQARERTKKAYLRAAELAEPRNLPDAATRFRSMAEDLPEIPAVRISRPRTKAATDRAFALRLADDIERLEKILDDPSLEIVEAVPVAGRRKNAQKVYFKGDIVATLDHIPSQLETLVTVSDGDPAIATAWTIEGTLPGDARLEGPVPALRALLKSKREALHQATQRVVSSPVGVADPRPDVQELLSKRIPAFLAANGEEADPSAAESFFKDLTQRIIAELQAGRTVNDIAENGDGVLSKEQWAFVDGFVADGATRDFILSHLVLAGVSPQAAREARARIMVGEELDAVLKDVVGNADGASLFRFLTGSTGRVVDLAGDRPGVAFIQGGERIATLTSSVEEKDGVSLRQYLLRDARDQVMATASLEEIGQRLSADPEKRAFLRRILQGLWEKNSRDHRFLDFIAELQERRDFSGPVDLQTAEGRRAWGVVEQMRVLGVPRDALPTAVERIQGFLSEDIPTEDLLAARVDQLVEELLAGRPDQSSLAEHQRAGLGNTLRGLSTLTKNGTLNKDRLSPQLSAAARQISGGDVVSSPIGEGRDIVKPWQQAQRLAGEGRFWQTLAGQIPGEPVVEVKEYHFGSYRVVISPRTGGGAGLLVRADEEGPQGAPRASAFAKTDFLQQPLKGLLTMLASRTWTRTRANLRETEIKRPSARQAPAVYDWLAPDPQALRVVTHNGSRTILLEGEATGLTIAEAVQFNADKTTTVTWNLFDGQTSGSLATAQVEKTEPYNPSDQTETLPSQVQEMLAALLDQNEENKALITLINARREIAVAALVGQAPSNSLASSPAAGDTRDPAALSSPVRGLLDWAGGLSDLAPESKPTGERFLPARGIDPHLWRYFSRFLQSDHGKGARSLPLKEQIAFLDQLGTRLGTFVREGADFLEGTDLESVLKLLFPEQLEFVVYLATQEPDYQDLPMPIILADLILYTLPSHYQREVRSAGWEGFMLALADLFFQHPELILPRSAAESRPWPALSQAETTSSLRGRRGLFVGQASTTDISLVRDFFIERGRAETEEFYVDFLDRLSTRLMQFILDGARLEQDALTIHDLLSSEEQAFIDFLIDRRGKNSISEGLSAVILQSLSLEEARDLGAFFVVNLPEGPAMDELEIFVQLRYGEEGLQTLPEIPSVTEYLDRLQGVRGLQYEFLGPWSQKMVKEVIPQVANLGWTQEKQTAAVQILDQIETRIVHLLWSGAQLGPHTAWMIHQLDLEQQQILERAAGILRQDVNMILENLVFDWLSEDLREVFLDQESQYPPEMALGRKISRFVSEQDYAVLLSSPVPGVKENWAEWVGKNNAAPEGYETGTRGLGFQGIDREAWGLLNRFYRRFPDSPYVPLRERLAFFDKLATRIGTFIQEGARLEQDTGIILDLLSDDQRDFIDFLAENEGGYKNDPLWQILGDLVFFTLTPQQQEEVLTNHRSGGYTIGESLQIVLDGHTGIMDFIVPRPQPWGALAAAREDRYPTGKRGLLPDNMPQGLIDVVADFFSSRVSSGQAEQGEAFYLDFLDRLSTRLMQFILDGASLRNDAARIVTLLSDDERAFVQSLKDKSNTDDDTSVLAVIIQLSFSMDERESRREALPLRGDFSVEDLEDFIRMMYARAWGPELSAEMPGQENQTGERGLDFVDIDSRAWGYLNQFFDRTADPQGLSPQERLAFLDRLTTRIMLFIMDGTRLEGEHGNTFRLMSAEQWAFVDFLREVVPSYMKKALPDVLAELVFLTLSPQQQARVLEYRRNGRDDVASLEMVLNGHPGIRDPIYPQTASRIRPEPELDGRYLSGKRGLLLESLAPDAIEYVRDFFAQYPEADQAEQGEEFYLDFLDRLSTRLMQLILDGTSLRADEANVLRRLPGPEQAFIQYLKDKFKKDTAASVMSVIIRFSLSEDERQGLPQTWNPKPFLIEDVEDSVRLLYARSGIDYLPATEIVQDVLAKMPKTRGSHYRYEDLGQLSRRMVDEVIPFLLGWDAPTAREAALTLLDELTTRVFYLLQLGAELGPHTDWIVRQLEERHQRVLTFAIAEKGESLDQFLGQLMIDSLPLEQRRRFYQQLPFPLTELPNNIHVLARFIRDQDSPVHLSSPVSDKPVGGIDLNAGLLDLQIKRDGRGVPLPLPQQPIERMHIDGFIPVILNITPVPSLPLLLGLVTGADDEGHATAGAPTGADTPVDKRDVWVNREPEELSLAR